MNKNHDHRATKVNSQFWWILLNKFSIKYWWVNNVDKVQTFPCNIVKVTQSSVETGEYLLL